SDRLCSARVSKRPLGSEWRTLVPAVPDRKPPTYRVDAKNPAHRRNHPMNWLRSLFGGRKQMPALSPGTAAPDFTLPTVDGKQFSLKDALTKGPVVAAFF